jgi:hypothetical protein
VQTYLLVSCLIELIDGIFGHNINIVRDFSDVRIIISIAHHLAISYLFKYFMPGFDKNLVDGRYLALLASDRKALVLASFHDGGPVATLPYQ